MTDDRDLDGVPRVAAFKTVAEFKAHLATLPIPLDCDDELLRPKENLLGRPITVYGKTLGNRFATHPMEGWDGALDPEIVLHDDLLVTHGDMARKWGGYTAKAHSKRYVNSVMHGHTHRMGSHVRRVPAVGARGEQIIRAYQEIGCMCQLNPGYTSVPDWSQGFAVVVGTGSSYAVELVNIIEGRATVAALSTTGGGPTTWAGAQKETGMKIPAVGMDYTRVNLDLVRDGEVFAVVGQPLWDESKAAAELLALPEAIVNAWHC